MRRRREICTSMERFIAEYLRLRVRFISLSRESGLRGWLISVFSIVNLSLVSGIGSFSRNISRVSRLSLNLSKVIIVFFCDGAFGSSFV